MDITSLMSIVRFAVATACASGVATVSITSPILPNFVFRTLREGVLPTLFLSDLLFGGDGRLDVEEIRGEVLVVLHVGIELLVHHVSVAEAGDGIVRLDA